MALGEKFSLPENVGDVGDDRVREVEDFRAASQKYPFCSRAESTSALAVCSRNESPSSSTCGAAKGTARGGDERWVRSTGLKGLW